MKSKIWAALIVVYIVWGSTYLAIRFAVESMPPFLMAGVRFLTAGVILFGWRRLAGDKRPLKIEWRSAAIIGGLLLVGGNGNVVWAEQHVASGIAALIVGSAPLWMVAIDAVRPGGKKANFQTWAGVLIGFIGILVLINPLEMLHNPQQVNTVGIFSLLFGAFLWALGSLYSRNAALPESPLLGTGMEMLAGGVGFVILGTITNEWAQVNLSAVTARSIWGLLYLIIFGSLVGYSAYTWLLRNAPTPLVSTYAYVNPMVAILLGALFAGEALTLRILIAALIVISSVALINTARVEKPKPVERVIPTPMTGDD
ncbi:MAG: EamA family transporter [Chloroflexi bacterium]|nr:EamA family transporter [Chloroflexota bacterium]